MSKARALRLEIRALRNSKHMFKSARIKLTAWYLLIIMLISISFSTVIYNFLTSEFNRVVRMEKLRQKGLWNPPKTGMIHIFLENNEIIPERSVLVTPPSVEVIEEAKNRLLYTLIVINLAILGISGALGYFLASRTLKPIKDMVDEQNRFITDASHELRTPLTSLKSEIEVNLRDKNLKLADAKKILESNLEEINSLQYLSDNLIKLAQTHQPNGIKFEEISVETVATQALKKVEKLAKKKNIKIETAINNVTLLAGRQSLLELLVIFLDNAIKYSPENSIIHLNSKKSGSSVIIAIKDQGFGIEKKDLPNLFDRFYRSNRARSKKDTGGFGLGLSIAKDIVDKHNGSINVKSEGGKGTTFTVKLPIKN